MPDDPYLTQARAMAEHLIALRRDIHQHPELAFAESRTAALGQAHFAETGLQVKTGIAGTHGLVATLDTGRPGPTILLRGDMDALPLEEQTGADYASQTPGVMHACGHDVHTTCILGAARLLAANAADLRGRVQFLLQPAEEVPPGGAKVLVEQGGICDGVDAAVAIHVQPYIPVGQIGLRSGVLLANSDRFSITITGKGGHAARPHNAIDPIAVAVQVYQALQYVVTRENDPLHPFVITVGALNGGHAANVIPNHAELLGTVRSLRAEVRAGLPARLERLVRGICEATGATYEFEFTEGYPALVNDPALMAGIQNSVEAMLGPEAVHHIAEPEMGGEDFAFIAQRVPAAMIRLGVGNEARGIVHPVHSPRFEVDEDAIPIGVATMARIAHDYLAG